LHLPFAIRYNPNAPRCKTGYLAGKNLEALKEIITHTTPKYLVAVAPKPGLDSPWPFVQNR
jgi:hypothetical protein